MNDPEADPGPASIQRSIARRELSKSLMKIFNVRLPEEFQGWRAVCHLRTLKLAVKFCNPLFQGMLLFACLCDQAIFDHEEPEPGPLSQAGLCAS